MPLAQSIFRSSAMLALVAGLTLAGCAKQTLPDNAGGLGLSAERAFALALVDAR